MISMYKWQQIKVLRVQGMGVKRIAKKLGISKNTVKKYLRSTAPPEFKVREYEKMLDNYEGDIKEMLSRGYIGTRIFAELRKVGYEGSLSTVHQYIRKVKRGDEIRGKVTTRVETPPGKQMQYDWTEWDLPVGGRKVRIYLPVCVQRTGRPVCVQRTDRHNLVLSYSRKKYYTYSLSITTSDVIRAIAEGIEFFGGGAGELVIDNPRQMVITHDRDGIVRYPDEFLRFCGLYGIEPSPCRNYRARTKGKVERPFYYIQEHLLRGLAVDELCEFEVLLREFTERYNKRTHSSLKEAPDDRFKVEKGYLRDIPLIEPAIVHEREIRKVSNDGYISWDGGLYPVPMRLCLRDVMVEAVFGKTLKVYDKGEVVVEHQKRLFDKDKRPACALHADRSILSMRD